MGECRDIDECFLKTHACVLTDGQVKVSKLLLGLFGHICPVLYNADGSVNTRFIKNLSKDCLNTPGSYVCPCLSGYEVDVAASITQLGMYNVTMTS